MEIADYKILMVDDDEEYLFAKSMYFAKKGYAIKTINDPSEVLEYLKTNTVDILIVDYFMPGMTGEQLIKELRELNKDIVIILQTGYAGQKPPKEMFEGITIQGYFNKNDDIENLEIIILASLRTAELLREVKYHEQEKYIRNLKDEFFSDKIKTISGEINEELMGIGGPTMVLEKWADENITNEEKEFIIKRLAYIKDAADKIKLNMQALNIVSEREMTSKSMLQRINELLKIELKVKGVKLNIEPEETFVLINTEEGIVPYLICRDIENRVNADNVLINITSDKDENNNVIIKILSEKGMKDEEKEQLEKVADFCKNVKIIINEKQTELLIEGIKQ